MDDINNNSNLLSSIVSVVSGGSIGNSRRNKSVPSSLSSLSKGSLFVRGSVETNDKTTPNVSFSDLYQDYLTSGQFVIDRDAQYRPESIHDFQEHKNNSTLSQSSSSSSSDLISNQQQWPPVAPHSPRNTSVFHENDDVSSSFNENQKSESISDKLMNFTKIFSFQNNQSPLTNDDASSLTSKNSQSNKLIQSFSNEDYQNDENDERSTIRSIDTTNSYFELERHYSMSELMQSLKQNNHTSQQAPINPRVLSMLPSGHVIHCPLLMDTVPLSDSVGSVEGNGTVATGSVVEEHDIVKTVRLKIEFGIQKQVPYGCAIGVVGNIEKLGKWKLDRMLVMKWHSGNIWKGNIENGVDELKSCNEIEYKYVVLNCGNHEITEWESRGNRVLKPHEMVQQVEFNKKSSFVTVDYKVKDEWNGKKQILQHEIVYSNNNQQVQKNTPVPVSASPIGVVSSHIDSGLPKVLCKENPDRMRPFMKMREISEPIVNGNQNGVIPKASPSVANSTTGKCKIRFKMEYPTQYGDSVFVCGSIPELGCWRKDKAPKMEFVRCEKMNKSDGKPMKSTFELEIEVSRSILQFEYKYFVWKSNGDRIWEVGYNTNRVAMPFLMNTQQNNTIFYNDQWEMHRILLSIYYPVQNPDEEVMSVTGDPLELGGWFRPGPIPMELGENEVLETDVIGRKWKITIYLPYSVRSFEYRYVLMNVKSKSAVWEREPNRKCVIDGNGVIVNSTCVLKDVNFVAGMEFDYIPDSMFCGPYPQCHEHIVKLKQAGVTAVINLQTDEDFRHRHIQWNVLLQSYKSLGIEIVRWPIMDFDRESLRAGLHGAALKMNELIQNGHQVFVHCSAGMGRAPALIVAYLVFCKNWQLQHAVDHVKYHRRVSAPNVPLLQEMVNQFRR
eukprot:CAMPEP_0182445786 /NCGR_PEP_ID=MMETSP1172-20130603/3786_1 /TAXON_ID=708627 /ORGANISM="Timspurckia oligopyrenoides, Strain CCMP3278" /LENGTH=893 /DNA_ID=CAMNT_0024641611 /DNA_START=112 /DNA_END=2793 /DNA_ORIENTATION=+